MKLIQTIIAALIIAILCLWEHPRADVTIGSNFDVTTSGSLVATADLTVGGSATIAGDTAITAGGLAVNQSATIGGALAVGGDGTVAGNLAVSGDLSGLRPMQAVGGTTTTLNNSQTGWWLTVNSNGAASTVNLPASPNAKVWYTFTCVGVGAGTSTISGNGNTFLHPTLGQVGSFTMGLYQSVEVIWDSGYWLVH